MMSNNTNTISKRGANNSVLGALYKREADEFAQNMDVGVRGLDEGFHRQGEVSERHQQRIARLSGDVEDERAIVKRGTE